jgi:IS4 transposase
MAPAQYARAPESFTVRDLATGGKIPVTTLLRPKQTPKADLRALYRARGQVEIGFRHLKTALGLEMLSCKTPETAQKEV